MGAVPFIAEVEVKEENAEVGETCAENKRDPARSSTQLEKDVEEVVLEVAETVGAEDVFVPEDFECPICCEKGVEETFQISGCGHRFCTPCLNRWYTQKVDEGCVEITCPYSTDNGLCGTAVLRERLNEVIHSGCYQRRERLLKLKNEMARECPYCEYIQIGNPSSPTMNCKKCQKEYCFVHSNAHVGMTCKQYEKQHRREFKKNKRVAGKGAKICPGCNAFVSKIEGCNHMTCRCGMEFCNICGEDITGKVGQHYMMWCNQYDQNIFKNLADHGDVDSIPIAIWRVMYGVYSFLVYGPIVLAVMAAITPFYFLYCICTCRRGITCYAFFLRWAHIAEGTFMALLTFSLIIPMAFLCFFICMTWKYRCSWKSFGKALVYTAELTRCGIFFLIALFVFLLSLPIFLCLCCCSCFTCCGHLFAHSVLKCELTEDPWFVDLEVERDIVQIPFLTLYGGDALEHWDEWLDSIFQPF